jgi:predicted enzyme related to lactoylglutathione lyase
MKIAEIAYSSYPVTDMERARAFYEGLFQLEPTMVGGEEGGGQWVEYEIQGQVLALANVSLDWKPSKDGACIALELEDFDAALTEIKEKNIPVSFGPIDTPVCRMMGVSDPDGSQIILHKRKEFSTP